MRSIVPDKSDDLFLTDMRRSTYRIPKTGYLTGASRCTCRTHGVLSMEFQLTPSMVSIL
jgi:hypothetical protein